MTSRQYGFWRGVLGAGTPVLTPAPFALHLAIRRRGLLALMAMGWAPGVRAASARELVLRVVTAPDPAPQRQILQALKAHYPALVAEADPAAFDTTTRRAITPIVAVGPAALRKTLESDIKGPLVSVFTSSQNYRRLLGPGAHDRSQVTAIHADASPQSQLQLIAALFERRVTVGVLLSEASAYLERPLRQAAVNAGIELAVERADPALDVVRSLNRLSGTQVLLAVPDSTLYTPDTLRSVLESTYRRGLPVIGFSAATVAAGTLATAHATADDVLAELVELIDGLGQAGGPVPEARFPRYWRVSVNENVARSLGIAVSDRVLNMGNRPNGRPS